MMEKLQTVNDICLFVDDLNVSEQFYTEKMGFTVKRRQPGYIEFQMSGTSVTLWQKPGVYRAIPEKALGPRGHHFMIAVRVPALQEVDDIWTTLMERGVSAISEPETYPWGARAAYFPDPDGNIWEIFAWEESDGPGLQ